MHLSQEWDKTFPKSEKVDHQKVTFKNRYGITLAADLYVPKSRAGQRLAALAVSGPFGAVKEQSSGLYAQTMAERGYVTLAFDPSYTGESTGEPRHVPSPEINTEDFSAAVDFLGLQPSVDRHGIGIIGICGFAGMGLSAAAVDPRIKAVVTTSMYDMSRVMAHGYYDKMTPEQRRAMLEHMSEQRWADAEKGSPASGPRVQPVTLDGVKDPVIEMYGVDESTLRMYFDYYRTPRGFHERSLNSNGAWTATGPTPFMNLPLLTHIDEISPRPILMIIGDAIHVDLYDGLDKIPFDRMSEFFGKHLKHESESSPGPRPTQDVNTSLAANPHTSKMAGAARLFTARPPATGRLARRPGGRGLPVARLSRRLGTAKRPDRLSGRWSGTGSYRGENVTVGVGLRAQRHNDKVTRWYFVVNGRVGVDFSLLGPDDRPLTKKQLVAKIGPDAITDRPQDFRTAIDTRLFGLGTQRYEQLLTLVLTLRRPQLAKHLDPKGLSRTLSDGLRPLDDELIGEAARLFDDIEIVQRTLDGLPQADNAATAFLASYITYLRTHAEELRASVDGGPCG